MEGEIFQTIKVSANPSATLELSCDICDLLPQNECEVVSLHTEIKPVMSENNRKIKKENQHRILTFAGQNKELELYHTSF